ncbi:MAG: MmcQ/YjbR family DNA-binding protein [Alphaproteobacteria bacterium]|nr:MmcQ/YjbR family DNA-binding protein [Alphaproteobacteria bacterium]
MTKKKEPLARIEAELRDHALDFPESHEDFPWGERALKVKGKVFVFMRCADGTLGFSVKLPFTRDEALADASAKPTGYGLGKSGWVTFTYETDDEIPVERIKRWIGESYRAVAPRKLVELLDGPKPKAPRRRA